MISTKKNMSKKIKAIDIAEYFLFLSKEKKNPITNKKLQKLLYYSQAWFLVLNNKKMFTDKIEAWIHGPAVRDVYIKYKKFGFSPIEKEISESVIAKIPSDIKTILNEVWTIYGSLDPSYLEFLTHSELPWKEARRGLQGHENSENEISTKTMKEFYSEKYHNLIKK